MNEDKRAFYNAMDALMGEQKSVNYLKKEGTLKTNAITKEGNVAKALEDFAVRLINTSSAMLQISLIGLSVYLIANFINPFFGILGGSFVGLYAVISNFK